MSVFNNVSVLLWIYGFRLKEIAAAVAKQEQLQVTNTKL